MRRAIVALLAGVVVASAAAEARPIICPMLYKPVCGVTRYHRTVTFGNACLARADHARVLYSGRCSRRR